KPKAYYDRGEGFPTEDQVTELVELWKTSRSGEVSDFDLFAWRKSFRIMLGHRQISYTDLHRVVTALVERKHLELDYNRYRHPYD
ncbi:hypothetical protein C6A85_20030, partial [Mycobacterium sp. ITM-2017-0098]